MKSDFKWGEAAPIELDDSADQGQASAWGKAPSVETDEEGTPIEDRSNLQKTGDIIAKGIEATEKVLAVPTRIIGRVGTTGLSGASRGLGGLLNTFSKIGTEGSPGRKMVESASDYLTKIGKERRASLNKYLEGMFGVAGPKEETVTQFAERLTDLYLMKKSFEAVMPGGGGKGLGPKNLMPQAASSGIGSITKETIGNISPEVAGAFGGQLTKEMGGSETAQSRAEMGSMLLPTAIKAIWNMFTSGKIKSATQLEKAISDSAGDQNFDGGEPPPPGGPSGPTGKWGEPPPPGSMGTTGGETPFSTAEEAHKYLADYEGEVLAAKQAKAESDILKQTSQAQKTTTAQKILSNKPIDIYKAKPLEGRVTKGGEPISRQPPKYKIGGKENQKENILNTISPTESESAMKAGESQKDILNKTNRECHTYSEDLYTNAGELNEEVRGYHTNLMDQLVNRYKKLEIVPELSGVEKSLQSNIRATLNEIADFEGGALTISGENSKIGSRIATAKEASNPALIGQVKSIGRHVQHDFIQGKPSNIFNPVSKEIRDSAYAAAEASGIPEAESSLRAANEAYTQYNKIYNNKYINPLRDPGNRDYIKFYDELVSNQDYFREVEKAIGHTEEGANLLKQAQRDLADKKLSPFVKEPALIRTPGYRKTIKELSDTIPAKQMKSVKSGMEELVPKKLRKSGKDLTPAPKQPIDSKKLLDQSEKDIKAMARYGNKRTEEVRTLLDSRTGIRQLKRDLSGSKRGMEIFNKNAKMKAGEIVRGNKVKGDYTGNTIKKTLNETKNYELLSELTSPAEAEQALEIAERLGKKQVTRDNIAKMGKRYAGYRALRFILPF